MEDTSNKAVDLPLNYVTINDLKKRWLENKEKEKSVFTENKNIFKSENKQKKYKKNKTLVLNLQKQTNTVWVQKSVVFNPTVQICRKTSHENNTSKYKGFDRFAKIEGKFKDENNSSKFGGFDRKMKNVNSMVEIEEKFSDVNDIIFDRLAEINRKYRNVNMNDENSSKFSDFNQKYGGGDLTAEIVSKFRVFEIKDGKEKEIRNEKNDRMAENEGRFKGFRKTNRMGDFSSNDKNKRVIGSDVSVLNDQMVETNDFGSDKKVSEIKGEISKRNEGFRLMNGMGDFSSNKRVIGSDVSVLNDQMVESNDFGSDKKGSEISKRNEGFSKNVVGDLMAEYEKKDDPIVENRDLKRRFNKNLKRNRIAEKGQKYVDKSVLENPKDGGFMGENGSKISDLRKNELTREMADLKSSDNKNRCFKKNVKMAGKGQIYVDKSVLENPKDGDFMGENESKISDLRKNELTCEMADLKSSDNKKGGKNRCFKKNFKIAEKGQIYVDKSVLKNGDSTVENEWKQIGKEENDDIESKKNLVPENKLIDPTAEISDLKNDVKKTRVRNRGFKKNLKMVEKVQIYVEKSVLEDPKGENGDFTGDEKKVGEKKGFGKKSVGDRTKGLMDVWKIVLGDPSGENENVAKNLHFSTNKEKGGEKKGHKKGENSGFRSLKNVNKGKVKNGVDSGLVWVRKEEKSDDVCVAGNCCEGVLAKAGENEKKPCRGRQ